VCVVYSFELCDKCWIVWCVRQNVIEAKDGYDVNLFRGHMKNYVFGFIDVDGHPVARKPIRQLCEFRANPSEEIL
jgi:hypothetical protein